MKKLRILVIILFLCIVLHYTYVHFSKGRSVFYGVKIDGKEFQITELYTKNYKNDYPNYYIEIKGDGRTFNFEIPDCFKGNSYIIEDIKYFTNETYACLLPIFSGDKVISDILCYKKDNLYHYSSIANESLELNQFASSIDNIMQTSSNTLKLNNLEIYSDNLNKNMYLVLSNYHGIDIIHSKKLQTVTLFESDIYTQKIKAQVGKYYVVADYNETHDFHELYRVDVTTGKVTKIISEFPISFDSYIQGVVGDCLYLFDKDAKIQYKIDVREKTVTVNGTIKKGIEHYSFDRFRNVNAYLAYTDELYFDIYPIKKVDVSTHIQVGHIYSGYNYIYAPSSNEEYMVFHTHVQNDALKTYAFNIRDIKRINYTNSGVYYIDEGILYYYSPLYGNRPLIENKEWNFNSSLVAYIYEK